MSQLMIKCVAAGLAGAYLESKYQPAVVLGLGGVGPTGLPQAFGLTPLLLTGLSFWILGHGFTAVNHARAKYMDLAEKDGEKDVKERYALPNLYAQGTSKFARAFNCVQRSHQQIFETFPQTCLMSMVGAVHYPITTAATLAAYAVGRIVMSTDYAKAEDDPSKRYTNPLSRLIWYGYVTIIVVSVVSGVSILMGKPAL